MSFAIPPEDCLLALAFRDSKSLREAATRLRCDPATLVRRARRAADDHGLLQKVGGRWQLTAKGSALVRWAEEAMASQAQAASARPLLRIATTMWLSEQLLVPRLPALGKRLGSRYDFLVSTPGAGLEADLLGGRCDFVIACGAPSDPLVKFKRILPEVWVVAAPSNWAVKPRPLEKLAKLPFVRHSGLHPEELLALPSTPQLSPAACDHLIGIRAAIANGLGWSLVPEILVRGESRITVVDLEVPLNGGHLSLWWRRGSPESARHAGELGAWLAEAGK